jgi:hypothetical protein
MLVLYILSIGPMHWMLARSGCSNPMAIIGILYGPILKLCQSHESLTELILWYMQTCAGCLDL